MKLLFDRSSKTPNVIESFNAIPIRQRDNFYLLCTIRTYDEMSIFLQMKNINGPWESLMDEPDVLMCVAS